MSINLGADWEQSKRLVAHWHKMWARSEQDKKEMIKRLKIVWNKLEGVQSTVEYTLKDAEKLQR